MVAADMVIHSIANIFINFTVFILRLYYIILTVLLIYKAVDILNQPRFT